MAYAERVAENSLFNLRISKLNVNQTWDMMGYTNHVVALFYYRWAFQADIDQAGRDEDR